MKKAFTMSELLITMTVIGILMAILIPTINNARPNRDQTMYKKAMYNVQTAVSKSFEINTTAGTSSNGWKALTGNEFCTAMSEALNTAGAINCASTSSYASPNFSTTDGLRYWGLEGKFSADTRTIYVDYKMGGVDKAARKSASGSDSTGLRIKIQYDGKVTTDSDWTYENKLLAE